MCKNCFMTCPNCGGPLKWNDTLKCWVCDKCEIVVTED